MKNYAIRFFKDDLISQLRFNSSSFYFMNDSKIYLKKFPSIVRKKKFESHALTCANYLNKRNLEE